jgi:hypothetical protein
MANINAPFGFRLVRDRTNGGSEEYDMVATYATAMGKGDPVKLTGSGRNVELAPTTAVTIIGVINGFEYTAVTGERVWSTFWPGNVGNTAVKVLVDPIDVGQKWEVMCDTLAATDIGAQFEYVVGTATAAKGHSLTYLNVTGSETATKVFFVDGLANSPSAPNNAYGAYAIAVGHFVKGPNLTYGGGV